MLLVQHTHIITGIYQFIIFNLFHTAYLYKLYYSIKYSQQPQEVGTDEHHFTKNK